MKDMLTLFFHLMALPASEVEPVTPADLERLLAGANMTMEHVVTREFSEARLGRMTEIYKNQDKALTDWWVANKDRRDEATGYRERLRNSFVATEAALPSYNGASMTVLADQSRQISVRYLNHNDVVQMAVAYIPVINFAQSGGVEDLKTLVQDTSAVFENISGAPFAKSVLTVVDEQFANAGTPGIAGAPVLLSETNGHFYVSMNFLAGLSIIYLPREEVEGLPSVKDWFTVLGYLTWD